MVQKQIRMDKNKQKSQQFGVQQYNIKKIRQILCTVILNNIIIKTQISIKRTPKQQVKKMHQPAGPTNHEQFPNNSQPQEQAHQQLIPKRQQSHLLKLEDNNHNQLPLQQDLRQQQQMNNQSKIECKMEQECRQGAESERHELIKQEQYPDANQQDNQNDDKEEQNQNDNYQQQQNQQDQQPQQQQPLSPNTLDPHPNQKKRSHKKLDISNFIMKTYKILQDKRNSNIVEWTDQGNTFIVKDKDRFSKEILPKYFKHSKFSSFVRQLNMYDFHKIRKEKEIPIFKHKYFQQGRMDLLHKIKRKAGEEGVRDEDIGSRDINLSDRDLGHSLSNLGSNINLLQSVNQPEMRSPTLLSQPNPYNITQVPSSNPPQNSFGKPASTQSLPIKSQIQLLRRQNNELQQNINQIGQQIQFLQICKEKKKEKLVKIMSSIMFFDLNAAANGGANRRTLGDGVPGMDTEEIEELASNGEYGRPTFVQSLRTLQDHFVKDEEPLSFSQYRRRLSQIYGSFKMNLLI